jgi:hypothetical protein
LLSTAPRLVRGEVGHVLDAGAAGPHEMAEEGPALAKLLPALGRTGQTDRRVQGTIAPHADVMRTERSGAVGRGERRQVDQGVAHAGQHVRDGSASAHADLPLGPFAARAGPTLPRLRHEERAAADDLQPARAVHAGGHHGDDR